MRRMWSLDAKSRAEDRHGESVHNPLGAVDRVPGGGRRGEFRDEAAAAFTVDE